MTILHAIRYISADWWSSVGKISTASRELRRHQLSWCFCLPALSFPSNSGNDLLWYTEHKRQSNLLRCFFLVFTFNNMLENALPTLQKYGQLCLISEGLLVLCFSFIPRCMPQRLPLRQYLTAVWIYKHSCFWKTLVSPPSPWLQQIL